LRKVKDAPVIVLKDHRPAAIMMNLEHESLLSHPDVKLALATELFRGGHLSLGRAARLAGLAIIDFMRHLSDRRIPVIRSTARQATAELQVLKKWLASS
jgi:predicted HTH domain antitoxin